MTHNTPTRPEFGHTANPSEFFSRAYKAMDRATHSRDLNAGALADVFTGNPEEHWRLEYRAADYRKAVAAQVYAEAVYEVHAEQVRARRAAPLAPVEVSS